MLTTLRISRILKGWPPLRAKQTVIINSITETTNSTIPIRTFESAFALARPFFKILGR